MTHAHSWQQLYTRRSAELDQAWEQVNELEEMLTAATDTAVQRGKRIHDLERELAGWAADDEAGYCRYMDHDHGG